MEMLGKKSAFICCAWYSKIPEAGLIYEEKWFTWLTILESQRTYCWHLVRVLLVVWWCDRVERAGPVWKGPSMWSCFDNKVFWSYKNNKSFFPRCHSNYLININETLLLKEPPPMNWYIRHQASSTPVLGCSVFKPYLNHRKKTVRI